MSRLDLFPITTQVFSTPGGEGLFIGGCDLAQLAERFGTPLYVYDARTIETAILAYREALADFYPGLSGLTYAGKAYLCAALARWMAGQDIWLDCSSAGELGLAARAGVARECLVAHGVAKTRADLQAALDLAGVLVVDSLGELERLTVLLAERPLPRPQLWLRFRPGQVAGAHLYLQTGQENSKFGLSRGELLSAAQLCRENGLPLGGLHFHLGSGIHNFTPLEAALENALELVEQLDPGAGWCLCPGGGLAVAYHEDELPGPSIREYVRQVSTWVVEGCRRRGLPLPRLQLEPGRSLIARAGVAIYQVQAVKTTGERRWLLVDGGLADNPRPALYGTRYTALPVGGPLRPPAGSAWIGGAYCESGDILIKDLPLPELAPGELLAIPVSGAYQLSMASNYNGACRPPALWLEDGQAKILQTRELPQDLLRRDVLE